MRKLLVVLRKEQEWAAARILLADEKSRDLRTKGLKRDRSFEGGELGQFSQPFAARVVADLVMVLQEKDEEARRQIIAGRAARRAVAVRGRFALIQEALFQAASAFSA